MSKSLALLIGLGPLIGWGFFPTIASKIGGRPDNQILGATIGTLIFGIIFALLTQSALPTGKGLLLSIISGCGWGFGQTCLFKSFTYSDSSTVMPITTAWQLIVTDGWGIIALGNWSGTKNMIIGISCLIVIALGAWLTSYKENNSSKGKAQLKAGLICILIAGIGQWIYSAAPQASHVNGMRAFLPQAIGMLIVAVIYCLIKTIASHRRNHQKINSFANKKSYAQIVAGFFFAFGALTYLISEQPNVNGLATAFVLSQASVILATLTGIWILHQRKTRKEMIMTVIGLVLIVGATIVTSFL